LINETSFTIEALKDDGFVLSKIPAYLKNIKFKDPKKLERFESSFLQTNCQSWLNTCLQSLKQAISQALKYASNLKSLVIIRDATLEFELKLKLNFNKMGNKM
jgi:hypothetical protein